MTLPLLVSVPHARTAVPPELHGRHLLTPVQIERDGDEGARAIYDFAEAVSVHHMNTIARAFIDLNRAEDDRRKDGVVKTHTCWDEPVYPEPLDDETIERLISQYHRPYHLAISTAPPDVVLAVDCHTMAATGPPVGPDPGETRPQVCLSNGDRTCPARVLDLLAACFAEQFDQVAVNKPFRGGHIVRSHAHQRPWVQLELSRAPFVSDEEKRERVLRALTSFCARTSDSEGVVPTGG